MKFDYQKIDSTERLFIRLICYGLLLGISLGLLYVSLNSGIKSSEIQEFYRGNEGQIDSLDLKYAKTIKELLLTTHNHILSFLFIFFIVHFFWISVASLTQKIKHFFLIEPYISLIVTFSCMYLIRFISPNFVYLMLLSSSLLYFSLYYTLIRILWELKKTQ
jgi:hypothetical protein